MSIKDYGGKIKSYAASKVIPTVSKIKSGFDIKEDVFIVLAIALIGLAGFGLGKLSALEKGREPVQIRPATILKEASSTGNHSFLPVESVVPNNNVPMSASAMIAADSAKGLLVASKNGTKYHFPWCAGAKQIADKNKVWFNSYEEAQKAGYSPASNCPGLK
jgi:hypothetical protein